MADETRTKQDELMDKFSSGQIDAETFRREMTALQNTETSTSSAPQTAAPQQQPGQLTIPPEIQAKLNQLGINVSDPEHKKVADFIAANPNKTIKVDITVSQLIGLQEVPGPEVIKQLTSVIAADMVK